MERAGVGWGNLQGGKNDNVQLMHYAFITFAALLSVAGIFAFDAHLPALADIRSSFSASEAEVGFSTSIYMIAFAVGQLVYGPISDQTGRQPALLVGLSIFVAGTVGCALAQDIHAFQAFRFLQAIGVCGAYVLWQPIVIDRFEADEAQRVFTLLMAAGSVSPAIAPVAGGVIADSLGWRYVFWGLVGGGLVLLLWTLMAFKESLANRDRRPRISFTEIVSSYLYISRDKGFVGGAFTIALAVTLYLACLSVMPFFLAELGYTTEQIGFSYFSFGACFLAGAGVARVLHNRLGSMPIMTIGVAGAAGGVLLQVLLLVFLPSVEPWTLIAPVALIAFFNSFTVPTGSAYLIHRHAEYAGACASGLGFLVALLAAVSIATASALVGPLDVMGMLAITVVGCALMLFSFFNAYQSLLGQSPDVVAASYE